MALNYLITGRNSATCSGNVTIFQRTSQKLPTAMTYELEARPRDWLSLSNLQLAFLNPVECEGDTRCNVTLDDVQR